MIEKLTHASVCLDLALRAAEDGDGDEVVKHWIDKCSNDLDFLLSLLR